MHARLCLLCSFIFFFFFFSSRRRHTRSLRDWSSDVCSSDLIQRGPDFHRPDLLLFHSRIFPILCRNSPDCGIFPLLSQGHRLVPLSSSSHRDSPDDISRFLFDWRPILLMLTVRGTLKWIAPHGSVHAPCGRKLQQNGRVRTVLIDGPDKKWKRGSLSRWL